MRTRITDLFGIKSPIVQAPMGYIARSKLASAVSNAGGLGVIETSSGELDMIRDEIVAMKQLTDRPFAVNIAGAFVRDPGILEFVIEQGIKIAITSAGDPQQYVPPAQATGLTVFHVVPSVGLACVRGAFVIRAAKSWRRRRQRLLKFESRDRLAAARRFTCV